MTKQIKSLSESIYTDLRNRAREAGKPFQEILQYYGIERFLYRLSESVYRDYFVLKGATTFIARGMPITRPTRDIDLLGYTANTIENLERIIKEICTQLVEADGVSFDPSSVRSGHTQLGADYQGIRLRFIGHLSTARIPMQVDVGFGDPIVAP